jgi:hypothetical protein
MTKLKEIQNRKDVEFNFVLLWPKLKLKSKIDLPERYFMKKFMFKNVQVRMKMTKTRTKWPISSQI